MKKVIFIILFTLSSSLFSNITQIVGPYQSIIKDITFIDEMQKIGFVATGNGVYKTINGGVYWSSINGDLPFQQYISDGSIHTYTHPTQIIQTNDGKLIYALFTAYKSETKLFVTQDGGNHWSVVPYPKPYAAKYIKLTKDNHLILNNGQCLYEKNNIYEEFNELSCPKSQTINYVNNKLIYASPSYSNPLESFKKSVDGGKTWIPVASFGRNLGTNSSIIDVNGKALFIVKSDTEGQILASSIDEGMNWVIEYEI
ncbi:TPA: WD40/YVTN/BNR-like repeat-containing protein, partial [Legionella pneumophila]